MKNERTIAGDIRRIRKHLIPCGDGKFVKIDYCELLKMFDEIETKAKKLAEKEKNSSAKALLTTRVEKKVDSLYICCRFRMFICANFFKCLKRQ